MAVNYPVPFKFKPISVGDKVADSTDINFLRDDADTSKTLRFFVNEETAGSPPTHRFASLDKDDTRSFLEIPDAQIQSDWNQTDTTSLDFIKNKPTIPTGGGGELPPDQIEIERDFFRHLSKETSENQSFSSPYLTKENSFTALTYVAERTEMTAGVDTFTMVAGNAGFGDIGYVAPVQGSNQVGSISPSISGLNQMTNNSSDETLYLTFDSTSFPTDLASVFIDGTEYPLGTASAFSGNLYEQETTGSIPNLVNGSSYQIRFKKTDGTFYSAGGSSQTTPASLTNRITGSNITATLDTAEGQPFVENSIDPVNLVFKGQTTLNNTTTGASSNYRATLRFQFLLKKFEGGSEDLVQVKIAGSSSHYTLLNIAKDSSDSNKIKLRYQEVVRNDQGTITGTTRQFLVNDSEGDGSFQIGDIISVGIEFHKNPFAGSATTDHAALVVVADVIRGLQRFSYQYGDVLTSFARINELDFSEFRFHGGDVSGNNEFPYLPPELFVKTINTPAASFLRHSELREKLFEPHGNLFGFFSETRVDKFRLSSLFETENLPPSAHFGSPNVLGTTGATGLKTTGKRFVLTPSQSTISDLGAIPFLVSSITFYGSFNGEWNDTDSYLSLLQEGQYLVCLAGSFDNFVAGVGIRHGLTNMRHGSASYGGISTATSVVNVVGTDNRIYPRVIGRNVNSFNSTINLLKAHMHVVYLGRLGSSKTLSEISGRTGFYAPN